MLKEYINSNLIRCPMCGKEYDLSEHPHHIPISGELCVWNKNNAIPTGWKYFMEMSLFNSNENCWIIKE